MSLSRRRLQQQQNVLSKDRGDKASGASTPSPRVINAAPSLEKAEMFGIDDTRPVFSRAMALAGRVFIETIPQWLAVGAMLSLIFGGCCSNVFALESIIKVERDSGTLKSCCLGLVRGAECWKDQRHRDHLESVLIGGIGCRHAPHIRPIHLRRHHRPARPIRPNAPPLLPQGKQGADSTLAGQHRPLLQHKLSQQPCLQLRHIRAGAHHSALRRKHYDHDSRKFIWETILEDPDRCGPPADRRCYYGSGV